MATLYLATDHAGYELKEVLKSYLKKELGYEVIDCGAEEFDAADDYNEYIQAAAKAVAVDPTKRKAIILGGSGQGEAIAANRFLGVRAVVYYGAPTATQTDAEGEHLDIVTSTRLHNDANVLSLGARFISEAEAKQVVTAWLETEFTGGERHLRRIKKLDQVT